MRNVLETILLVEDADRVRALARDWLASSGYTVLEAKDPAEAIRIAGQHPSGIDLLLTDVVMPGMNGCALAEKLSALKPTMKVIYMSGYTGFRDLTPVDSSASVLQKPFTRSSLLGKLREVFARVSEHAIILKRDFFAGLL